MHFVAMEFCRLERKQERPSSVIGCWQLNPPWLGCIQSRTHREKNRERTTRGALNQIVGVKQKSGWMNKNKTFISFICLKHPAIYKWSAILWNKSNSRKSNWVNVLLPHTSVCVTLLTILVNSSKKGDIIEIQKPLQYLSTRRILLVESYHIFI